MKIPVLRRRAAPAVRGALPLLALLAGGCGAGPALYPVRGQVFVGDRPAAGAVVVLHPVGAAAPGGKLPSAVVAADGSFTVGTQGPGDGAPPGDYVVAVAWFADAARADPRSGEVPVQLARQYADPALSPLRARVAAAPNELPAYRLPK